MAQQTTLQPYGLPGQIRTFAAKQAAAVNVLPIIMLQMNHFGGGVLTLAFFLLLLL